MKPAQPAHREFPACRAQWDRRGRRAYQETPAPAVKAVRRVRKVYRVSKARKANKALLDKLVQSDRRGPEENRGRKVSPAKPAQPDHKVQPALV